MSVQSVVLIALIFLMSFNMQNFLRAQFHGSWDKKNDISYKETLLRKSQVHNATIYEDGHPHIEVNELNPALNKIKLIEDAYKSILAMNGVMHTFKRSFYWRTWREVKNVEGKSQLVCYRCQNVFNATCTSCNCGHWEIEENPPCPFEIFSVINKTNMCVTYYNQLNNSNTECSSIISFRDLGNCNNPLETRWRISRRHDATNISERYVNVICKTREICEFSTIYSIFPDRVTFKIINSSNNIIYSRVMKNNNRNYACLYICGELKSKQHTQIEMEDMKNQPFFKFKHYTGKFIGTEGATKKITKLNLDNLKHKNITHSYRHSTTTSLSLCKHLQTTTHSREESYDESEYNDN